MENCLVIQVFGRYYRLDDVLHEVLVDLVVRDVWGMLGGDEDGMHSLWDHCALLLLVLDSDLRLSIRPEPWHTSIFPNLQQGK